MARAAWELSRPIMPPAPETAPPKPIASFASAVGTILAIAGGGVLINMIVAIDWSQDGNFLVYEVFRRLLFLGLIVTAMALVSLRGRTEHALDDRPAPWLLYAT